MQQFARRATQARRSRPVPVSLLAVSLAFSAGCGGGGQSFVQPPVPDFSVSFSSISITLAQGSSSGAVTVSVTPKNGFSGQVQISLSTLPVGVTANPMSPFPVKPGTDVSLLFGASSSAVPGSVNLTATATSASLTHTAQIGLTVQAGTASPLSRSNQVRTNSQAAFDAPPDEPRHRHLAFDAANHHLSSRIARGISSK